MNARPIPVLLTSLASAALLDGQGNLDLVQETRGTPVDWGGVYGQLVRLTGPWRLVLHVDGAAQGLPESRVDARVTDGRWVSHHRWDRLEIVQSVAAVMDPPGVLRTLRCTVTEGPPIALTVESSWSPFLLPVLVEGIRPIHFEVETRGTEWRVRQRGFGLAFRSTVPASQLLINRASWRGGQYAGRVEELRSEHEVRVAPGSPAEITFLVHGGLERDLGRSTNLESVLQDPARAGGASGVDDATWTGRTATLRFPNAPTLELAYSLARTALRRLYSAPGDGLAGLVAGYPWYSSIWCRDLAWMLPAVLWLGDFDWTERSLTSVFAFQSRSTLPILGGEPGELPMQISPGPIFFYGTSDTSLYYPGLVSRLVRHSGRRASVDLWIPAVQRVIDWGRARTDPETGLLRHGGEVETISAAAASLARIRYGIDAPDTTIWDSTDRRPHAVDIQALWYDALLAASGLVAESVPDSERAAYRSLADRVLDSIRRRYPWPEERYLYDSLGAQGPVRKVRPNALRAVSAGLLDPNVAHEVVRRAAEGDLTTPWGVRTLSDRDPTYDPQAYHDGQVWTIATSWAADAAYHVGEPELGYAYLETIARHLVDEGGFAHECYRGDRPEPFNSCFLLGFSVAPFLTSLFEQLWGLAVDAERRRLTVRPSFPAGWTEASIERLSLGHGTVDLKWTPARWTVRWTGTEPLTVGTTSGEVVVPPGESRTLERTVTAAAGSRPAEIS